MSNTQNHHCQECGVILNHPAEFHPFEFCVLKKNGQDPRALYSRIVSRYKSGDTSSTESEGEVTRLREALEQIEARADAIQAYGIRDIASIAISSHREDKGGNP